MTPDPPDPIKILKKIFNLIFLLSMAGAVLMIIWIGLRYVRSKGGQEVSETNKQFLMVLAGLLLVMVASSIPLLVISFLK